MAKGIGKMLKKVMREDESTSKGISAADAINKACSKGITASHGAFSVLGIKKKLKTMISCLDDEDFDRDKFFSEFNSLYNLVMSPDKRAKGVFHPSALQDGCPKNMVYELSETPQSDKKVRVISGELQRIFDVGTWYHLYLQSILYNIGWLESAEVPVVNEKMFINGKADGVIKEEIYGERVLLEIKSMNTWTFQKALFKPYPKHEYQAGIYAKELGIKKVLFLYINKDTSEIKDFLVEVSEELLGTSYGKMNEVIDHVKNKTLPKGICSDRFCTTALECPYRTLCFK